MMFRRDAGYIFIQGIPVVLVFANPGLSHVAPYPELTLYYVTPRMQP